MDQRGHTHPEGRTTGHEPWWGELPTEPRIRPLSWHGAFPLCQEPEELSTSFFWWKPLIEVETSSFLGNNFGCVLSKLSSSFFIVCQTASPVHGGHECNNKVYINVDTTLHSSIIVVVVNRQVSRVSTDTLKMQSGHPLNKSFHYPVDCCMYQWPVTLTYHWHVQTTAAISMVHVSGAHLNRWQTSMVPHNSDPNRLSDLGRKL